VVNYSRAWVIHTKRKVPSGVADIDQTGRRVEIEPRYQDHVSVPHVTVDKIGSPVGDLFCTCFWVLQCEEVLRRTKRRTDNRCRLATEMSESHEIGVQLVRMQTVFRVGDVEPIGK
jgi:hypothetical protein